MAPLEKCGCAEICVMMVLQGRVGIYEADCCHAPPNIFEKSHFVELLVIHPDRQETFVLLRWLLADLSRSECGVRRSHVRSVR